MVEDVEVARAMDLFGKSLNAFEGARRSVSPSSTQRAPPATPNNP